MCVTGLLFEGVETNALPSRMSGLLASFLVICKIADIFSFCSIEELWALAFEC